MRRPAAPTSSATSTSPAKRPKPAAAEPAPVVPASASTPLPTAVEHSLTSAKDLDYAFVALPTATAAEQRAGEMSPEIGRPAAVERAIGRERGAGEANDAETARRWHGLNDIRAQLL